MLNETGGFRARELGLARDNITGRQLTPETSMLLVVADQNDASACIFTTLLPTSIPENETLAYQGTKLL